MILTGLAEMVARVINGTSIQDELKYFKNLDG